MLNNTSEDTCIINVSRLRLCGSQIWDALARNIGFSKTWEILAYDISGFHKLMELGARKNALDWYYNYYVKYHFENSQVNLLSKLDELNFDPLKNNLNPQVKIGKQDLTTKVKQQIISAMDYTGESSGEDFSTWLAERGGDSDDVLISYSRFEEKLVVKDYTLKPKEILENNNVKTDFINFDDVENNIKKYGFKVNIYSGKADTYAPPIIFEEMVERLKGHSTYTILESGHGGFLEDDIVWDSI